MAVVGQKSYIYDGGNKLVQEVANGAIMSYTCDANENLTQKSTGASGSDTTGTLKIRW